MVEKTVVRKVDPLVRTMVGNLAERRVVSLVDMTAGSWE